MAKSRGWIKLDRNLLESSIWVSDIPFDERSAWVDLILMVNHEDGEVYTRHKEFIKIPRGSTFTSIRKLANRWHWSVNRTKRYLWALSDMQMITLSGTHSGTLLGLVKYEDYQSRWYTDEHTGEHADGDADEYADGLRTRNKEYKNRRSSNRPATLQEKIEAMKRFIAEGGDDD